jgi:hypothetical protein
LNFEPTEPHLVINATELRTGSAFRFGTMESAARKAHFHTLTLNCRRADWRWAFVHSQQQPDAVADWTYLSWWRHHS